MKYFSAVTKEGRQTIKAVLILALCVLGAGFVEQALAGHRILFVGNSFVGFSQNALELFAGVSPFSKPVLGFQFEGGTNLEAHANRPATLNAIRCGVWDYVVLQDHSQRTIHESESFEQGVTKLVDEVRMSGAVPILYQTQARGQAGGFANYSGHQAIVVNAYNDIGAELGVNVARVGQAWRKIYQTNQALFKDLYQDDKIHPSNKGQYLVAVTLYRAIYNSDMAWAPLYGVNGFEALKLRSAALQFTSPVAPNINPAKAGRCEKPETSFMPAIVQLLLD